MTEEKKTKLQKLKDLGLLGAIKVEKKTLYQNLKDKGLIGFMKMDCDERGCRNLETTCKDCGRLVNSVQLENQIIRGICDSSPSFPDLDDPTVIAFDKTGKGYSAKALVQLSANNCTPVQSDG